MFLQKRAIGHRCSYENGPSATGVFANTVRRHQRSYENSPSAPAFLRSVLTKNGPPVFLQKQSIGTSVLTKNKCPSATGGHTKTVHRHRCFCENGPSAPVFLRTRSIGHRCSYENGPSAPVFLHKRSIGTGILVIVLSAQSASVSCAFPNAVGFSGWVGVKASP